MTVISSKSALAEMALGNTRTVLPLEGLADARRRRRYERRAAVARTQFSERLSGCGVDLSGAVVAVRVADGVGHVSGVKTCGLVWACPVCGPKIRHGRSLEVGSALREAERRGFGVSMLTLTVRHCRGAPLSSLMRRQEKAWRCLQQSRAWRDAAAALGVVGMVIVREVTYGEHGWHPHRHIAVVTRGVYGAARLEAWGAVVARRWVHELGRQGLSAVERWGCDVKPVSGTGLARYLEKVEAAEPGRPSVAALELVRGDLKEGAGLLGRGLTPDEVAEMVVDGEVGAIALWREYAVATAGRRMVTWTRGLRAALACDEELTDEELAALEVGGEVLAMVSPAGWWRLVGGGLVVDVLEAAEAGRDALGALLAGELDPDQWWLVGGMG